jgi:hypothetical protein
MCGRVPSYEWSCIVFSSSSTSRRISVLSQLLRQIEVHYRVAMASLHAIAWPVIVQERICFHKELQT